MPTNPNESELNAEPELDEAEELDLADSQQEIQTRSTDLEVRSLHDKHRRGHLTRQDRETYFAIVHQ